MQIFAKQGAVLLSAHPVAEVAERLHRFWAWHKETSQIASPPVGFRKSRKTATATADHETFTLQYSTTKQEFIKPRIYSDTRRALVFYQRVGPPPRLRQLATRLGILSMKP